MTFLTRIFNKIISMLVLLKFKIIYRRNFKFSMTDNVCQSLKIRITENGKVILGRNVSMRENVIINVTGGSVVIDNDSFFNDFCCINSRKCIHIEQGVMMGQSVKIYDHDHNYKMNVSSDFISEDVFIGDYVWIGSNTIILKGSTIGSHCVIGAGSVVKGNIESKAMYYNRIEPVIKQL